MPSDSTAFEKNLGAAIARLRVLGATTVIVDAGDRATGPIGGRVVSESSTANEGGPVIAHRLASTHTGARRCRCFSVRIYRARFPHRRYRAASAVRGLGV